MEPSKNKPFSDMRDLQAKVNDLIKALLEAGFKVNHEAIDLKDLDSKLEIEFELNLQTKPSAYFILRDYLKKLSGNYQGIELQFSNKDNKYKLVVLPTSTKRSERSEVIQKILPSLIHDIGNYMKQHKR